MENQITCSSSREYSLIQEEASRDIERSSSSSRRRNESKRPTEPWKGEYVKSVVYGGLDAIVTCFSLIASISATRLSSVDVLVLGFANLVADGISMGFGDFVSSSTEKDAATIERAVTEWDVTNHSVPQQMDLLRRYQALGMDLDDVTTVVCIFAKYEDILVDEKMMAHKGALPPDKAAEKPWTNSLLTFAAFILFGSVPLLSFIILLPFTEDESVKFLGACLLSVLALAFLGIAKARIAGQNYAFSIAMTLFNGGMAAAAAYSLVWALRNAGDFDEKH